MNINGFKALLVVLLSLLCTYMFWALCSDSEETKLKVLLCVSGFITMLFSFGGSLAIAYEDGKHAVNAKIVSWIFVIIFLLQHIAVSLIGIKQSVLIISSGILLILYLLVVYTINKTKM